MRSILLVILVCHFSSDFAFAANANVSGLWAVTSTYPPVTAQVTETLISHSPTGDVTTTRNYTEDVPIGVYSSGFSNVVQFPDGTIYASERGENFTETLRGNVATNAIVFSRSFVSHMSTSTDGLSTSQDLLVGDSCFGTIVPSPGLPMGVINCTSSGSYSYSFTSLGPTSEFYLTKTATFAAPLVIQYVNSVAVLDTYIVSGPTGTIHTRNVEFQWIGIDGEGALAAGYYYQMDSEPEVYTTATSKTFSDLSLGEHTFSVAAKDSSGNVDPTPATCTFTVEGSQRPVILVYGLNGTPGTWDVLRGKLGAAGIDYYIFDYPATGDPRGYAKSLKEWVGQIRTDTGYAGKFDIVCYSMGAPVSRYYMEKLDGAKDIGQWIGVAPVNHGADLANAQPFFFSWLRRLDIGWMGTEEAISQMKTNSPTVRALADDVSGSEVQYRVIAGVNTSRNISFGGVAGGRTLREQREEAMDWTLTHLGDGTVALPRSLLSGASIDCFEGLDHEHLPKDPAVCAMVLQYLTTASMNSISNIPEEDPGDAEAVTFGTGAGDIVGIGETQESYFAVDSTVQKAMIMCNWPGSELRITLVSPSGGIFEPNAAAEYYRSDTSIWYAIDNPEAGEWTAVVEAVDVPVEGEPFDVVTFYTSPLTLAGAICQDRTLHYTGELTCLVARIENNGVTVTGASVMADITNPDLSTDSLVLYDDGTHGDVNAGDGCYSAQYLLADKGAYQIVFSAHGTVAGTPFERTDPMTLWVTYPGDIDGDEDVDFADLAILANQWLRRAFSADVSPVGGDGTVSFADWAVFARAWQSIPSSLNWNRACDIAPAGGDNVVDVRDIAVFIDQWLRPSGSQSGDIAPLPNGDGIVNELDLAVMAEHWLEGR
jgi:pimeloyl-ACP methyl ester carboxylesterase